MKRGNDVGKLEGKVAFVSGGSQGIGEQIALLFGREGASVAVLASLDLAKAETVAKRIRDAGGQASAHVADVRHPDEVARVVSKVSAAQGPIDILINSAGVFPPTPAANTPEDVYDKVMDINVKGTWNAICAIAPSMRARKTGWIVNISSVLGTMALANYAVYCASKAAVNMLTRSLAIEFGRDGVHVNCIAPGNTATPMNLDIRTKPELKPMLDAMASRTPSGVTHSSAEDMANIVAFMVSDAARAMHGANILADEGFSAGM